ncbi:MAG: hypothetical protein CMB45_05220 [Euryarchaeota archaeon]|nr:hypothetical protein [Euryarchaeota archaeon]MBK38373.1 hypothetical protein [Euryarchaeota archaeon]|tara:strand:- start:6416 stop:6811 length:396 start_codon:yes stop_codon:yes gene_type:complete
MQQKVNTLELLINGEITSLTDVMVIKSDDGLYVEQMVEIGTDPEGKTLEQKQLSLYTWERVHRLVWTENTLIEQVKEAAVLEMLDGLEDLFDQLSEDEWEGEEVQAEEKEDSKDRRDDPNYNPYDDKKGDE